MSVFLKPLKRSQCDAMRPCFYGMDENRKTITLIVKTFHNVVMNQNHIFALRNAYTNCTNYGTSKISYEISLHRTKKLSEHSYPI